MKIDFTLSDKENNRLPILDGFPDMYKKHKIPGASLYHCYLEDQTKGVILLQIIQLKFSIFYLIHNFFKYPLELNFITNGYGATSHHLMEGAANITMNGNQVRRASEGNHNLIHFPHINWKIYFKEKTTIIGGFYTDLEALETLAKVHPKYKDVIAKIKQEEIYSLYPEQTITAPELIYTYVRLIKALEENKTLNKETAELELNYFELLRNTKLKETIHRYSFKEIELVHDFAFNLANNFGEAKIYKTERKKCKLKKDKLLEVFQRIFGCTPYNYLRRKKMEKAKELIDQAFSLEEVAMHVGYSSQQHLRKAFVVFWGQTIAEYRANKFLD